MFRSKQLKSAVAASLLLLTASSAFAAIIGTSVPANGLSDPGPGAADPTFLFSIDLMGNDATATLNATALGGGSFWATSGTLDVTSGVDAGMYSLTPGGPSAFTSPSGAFIADNVLFPGANPLLDADGLLFTGAGGLEVNIFGDAPDTYSFFSGKGASYNVEAAGTPDSVSLRQVPEPGTLALLSIALAGLGAGAAMRRRNLS